MPKLSFQGITVPREDWYWPKAETDDEEDDSKEEEEEEIVELTVSIYITFFIKLYNV